MNELMSEIDQYRAHAMFSAIFGFPWRNNRLAKPWNRPVGE